MHSANGTKMTVKGTSLIDFSIKGMKLSQEFIIVSDLSRNVILGRDFMIKTNARIMFDINKVCINKVYIPMERDVHLASIVRTKGKVNMQPMTAYLIKAKIKKSPYITEDQQYEFEPTNKGRIYQNPEIQVASSVSKIRKDCLTVQITNLSEYCIKLRKGLALGKVSPVCAVTQEQHPVYSCDVTPEQFKKDIHTTIELLPIIEPFLLSHSNVFAFSDSELTFTDLYTADIDTGNHPPINVPPYRIALNDKQTVSDTIDDLMKAGLIERSNSPWNFPLVLVSKKPEAPGMPVKRRVCVDFRRMNSIVNLYSYPLPLFDEITANLKGSTYFSTLDLRAGFHQIPLTKEASQKCSFSCFKGKFAWKSLPFGLNGAASIFQDMISKLLRGCEEFAQAYIDDILIHTKGDLNDHLQHIEIILNKMRRHSLKLKLSKCHWAMKQINYLGFVINQDGVSPDKEKVKAIRNLQPPSTVREVRSVLGMASYYRRFIPRFAKIAEVLISLTKKYARFTWEDRHQAAFDEIKSQLTEVPLLAYPDPNKPYILYTDASNSTIGAVLVQRAEGEQWIPGIYDEKPIYFISHKLSPSQVKSYSTPEKEMFAIHYSFNKLHHYLYNSDVTVKTDHQPLKHLFTTEQKNRRVQKWGLTIASYNAKIEYLKGTDNIIADLLSRSTPPANEEENKKWDDEDNNHIINECAVLNSNKFDPADYLEVNHDELLADSEQTTIPSLSNFNIETEQQKDPILLDLKNKLESDHNTTGLFRRFLLKEDVIYFISQVHENPYLRLYIPEHLQSHVMEQYHDENGHFGVEKVYNTIKQKFYWPDMYKHLQKRIDKCQVCKVRNLKAKESGILLTQLPPFPMAHVQLDLSGPHPRTLSGNVYIATFICTYSGWLEAFALPSKEAQPIVECLLEYIIPRFGTMLCLTTDNGAEFVNQYLRQTLIKLNIKHIRTSNYNPRGNGTVERSHKCLNHVMSKLINNSPETWDMYLNSALLAIRTNVSKSTMQSPFKLLYSRDPVLPLDNLLRPRRKTHSEDYHEVALENLHKSFIEVLKTTRKVKEARNRYKNRNRDDTVFKAGDPIYLKNKRKESKLDKNWLTHYTVIKKTGPRSFVLRHQLTGKETRAHADNMRLASCQWHIPMMEGKQPRRAQLATVPPSNHNSSASDSDSRGNVSGVPRKTVPNHSGSDDSLIGKKRTVSQPCSDITVSESDADSESTVIYDHKSYKKMGITRERKIRDNSSGESDIPEFEVKLRSRIQPKHHPKDTVHSEMEI